MYRCVSICSLQWVYGGRTQTRYATENFFKKLNQNGDFKDHFTKHHFSRTSGLNKQATRSGHLLQRLSSQAKSGCSLTNEKRLAFLLHNYWVRKYMLPNVSVQTTALFNISYKVLKTEHEFMCQMFLCHFSMLCEIFLPPPLFIAIQ